MNGQAQHKPLPRFNYRLETANDPGNGTASVFAQTSFDIIALNGKPVFSWGNVEPKGKRFKNNQAPKAKTDLAICSEGNGTSRRH